MTEAASIERERDLRCLARVREGDSSALGELYDRHTTSLLYPVALKILGKPADAEEVVQESWVQVWRTASSYDARRGSVAAWLLTITRSRALDRGRAASSKRRFETDTPHAVDAPDPGGDASDRLDDDERRKAVRSALDQLEPEQRRVLEYAYFGGLSQSRIAGRLERPLGTVKSWTRQGLTRLRTILGPGGVP